MAMPKISYETMKRLRESDREKIARLEAERDEARSIVRDIYWMALRYADGRKTYAPDMFNRAIRKAYSSGWLVFSQEGNRDPQYASDGMFDDEYVSAIDRATAAEAQLAKEKAENERPNVARVSAWVVTDDNGTISALMVWPTRDDAQAAADALGMDESHVVPVEIRALKSQPETDGRTW